ncbi:biotin/lipoyl-containing protein [Pseudonocardia sp. WMMC193]|uniref:acetyl-CoA carboxylase biotin carboxyl carrier protein n=1 Tax=Pseudonocardia sp. WMMC193 TaxID=2911965 RepID=UPI001F44852D|nr:biotin/lipoyl-containing protein [Pseudonocardia sp. WMMC193]MCF7548568.1 acetyl-CoA carboxylase biotin carboxyl carrier protein subunit [Pseudonocardia sp. WMMC193]
MSTPEPAAPSGLEAVLASLHRTATAMAADPRPPARIKLGVDGVTLEWDLLPTLMPERDRGDGPRPHGAVRGAGQAPFDGSGGAGPATAGPAAPAATVTVQHTLTAPTVGVFYRSSEPGAAPFVDTGDLVSPGQQVGIVEAMKLMIPVEADRGGRVVEVLCADATAVEFGAPLFALAEE